MGAFKDKSDETFSSGELLLSNAHYNSSVHCFYYSCFQLVKDLLKEEYKYSDSQMNSGTNNSSSHDKIISSSKLVDMIKVLGCGIGQDFDISKLKYHRIILLSDADVD